MNRENRSIGDRWQSLTMEIYEEIKRKIQEREYKQGQQLIIRDVAEELQVSVTPIQNALKMLQTEGLVVRTGRRGGVKVASLSAKNITEVLRLRQILEMYALDEAKDNLTKANLKKLKKIITEMGDYLEQSPTIEDEDHDIDMDKFSHYDGMFHEQLVSMGDNEILKDLYDRLWVKMKIIMNLFWTVKQAKTRRPEALHELQRLYEALNEGDIEAAKDALKKHYAALEEMILKRITETDFF